jgi:hypothetical protein
MYRYSSYLSPFDFSDTCECPFLSPRTLSPRDYTINEIMDGFSRPKKVHHGNRIGIVTRMSLFGLRGDLIEISFDLICTSYVTNWGLSGRSLTAGESQIIISWRASIHQSRHESAEHPRTTLSIADCRQGCHRATLILALSSAGMKEGSRQRKKDLAFLQCFWEQLWSSVQYRDFPSLPRSAFAI